MSVFFRRRGEPPTTTHTVTMVGGFDNGAYGSRVWVVINGTRYGTAGTVEAADLSDVSVYVDPKGGLLSRVDLNGETVLEDYGGSQRSYTFALTKDCTITDTTSFGNQATAEITM